MDLWNAEVEASDPAGMQNLQLERLRNLVKKLYENVAFYRQKMDEKAVKPQDIRTLEDIARLPFTSKDQLRETYPYGLLACDKKDLLEIHTSSGTTGKPVVGAYTKSDIELWGEVMARTLYMAGGRSGDTIQNAYGYGLFTGGLGVHYGARRLGANVLPISSGNTRRQLMIMQDFGTSLLTCTPSYSLYLAEAAKEAGIDWNSLQLKAGCFGAEPWSDSMRDQIEANLGISAHDIYGLTEIIGPGVASECSCKSGLHINEDHFYPEIIDPLTNEVLPDGEKGELVLTSLSREGSPLLRYRTRDITYLQRGLCACGRSTVRMHRLLGRTDDLLIVRGVNVFPSQIEQVLVKIEGTEPHYQIVVDRGQSHLDEIEIQVEVEASLFSDLTRNLENLRKKIHDDLKSELGISAHIRLVEPHSLERSEGKARRVIDKRSL